MVGGDSCATISSRRIPLTYRRSDQRHQARWKPTERGGFEPPVPCEHARFPSVDLKPLGHLSKSDHVFTCRHDIRSRIKPAERGGFGFRRSLRARVKNPPPLPAGDILSPDPRSARRELRFESPAGTHKKQARHSVTHKTSGERGIRSPRAHPARFVVPPRPSSGAFLAPLPRSARRGTRFESPSRGTKKPVRCRLVPATSIENGERGIRTPGTLAGSTVFETARFNRSRISPGANFKKRPFGLFLIPR